MKSLYQWINSSSKYKNSYFNRFKLKLRMFFKGCLALIFYRKNISEPIECDVLLIHPSLKSYKQGRKKKFINMLKNKGLVVEEFIEGKDKDIIFKRQFCKVEKIPFFFKWDAYHANYILNKYRAKVILTERNGWVIPSFIKKLRGEGSIVVHMAHSIPTGQSSKYNYYDYDFYFLYGESSFDYLNALKGSYGSCRVVFKGPYFFYDDRKYNKSRCSNNNITFLCSGPDFETLDTYIEICGWVKRLVEFEVINKLYIKCHPRGENQSWIRFSKDYSDRVEIVEALSLNDSLDNSDYAVMGYTNAIVDAAYYGIPIIMLGDSKDFFNINKFSIPWAKSYEELVNFIEMDARNSQKVFARYHINEHSSTVPALVNAIQNVVEFGQSANFSADREL